jgi:1-acyl-sn-glycerol-3-phosphate acyltransferase
MRSILAWLILRIGRYRLVNTPPDEPVMVLVAAPHTSNWDFPLMLAMAWKAGLSPKWLGKKELFAGPLGPVMRALGGVSVDRKAPGDLVATLAADARTSSSLALVVPAEGTRAKGDHWKSGFLRIATESGMPIVLSYLDGPTRTGGFGPAFRPSGDVTADMDVVRAFYADKGGVKPANKTEPRLREEDTLAG